MGAGDPASNRRSGPTGLHPGHPPGPRDDLPCKQGDGFVKIKRWIDVPYIIYTYKREDSSDWY